MANSPLPLLIAGGAALLLLGGKKKKATTAAAPSEPEFEEPEFEDPEDTGEEEMDQGDGPEPPQTQAEGPGYGSVASGIRKDKRGHHAWRIKYDADGYHALLMVTNHRYSPVADEAGVAASVKAAKGLLRDYFNELLIEKYPNEQPKNDPSDVMIATAAKLAFK